MATRISFNQHQFTRSAAFLLLAGTAFAQVGCRDNGTSSRLPPPSLDRPLVMPPKVDPLPTVAVVKPAPALPAPSKTPAYRPQMSQVGIPSDWTPPVAARPWRWIVIHHSATTTGGAAAFDRMHRAKGWDELGYDFVIGNGTDTADGQIEVGPRWTKQKYGAHAKTPDNRYNDFGIGICLVGNFDVERPTAAQMRSVTKIVSYLMRTYHVTPDRVLGHGDTKATDCPGKYMNVAIIRKQAMRTLVDAGLSIDSPDAGTQTAQAEPAGELMIDAPRQ